MRSWRTPSLMTFETERTEGTSGPTKAEEKFPLFVSGVPLSRQCALPAASVVRSTPIRADRRRRAARPRATIRFQKRSPLLTLMADGFATARRRFLRERKGVSCCRVDDAGVGETTGGRTSKERIGDTEQRRIGVCPRKSSVFFSRRIARTDQGDVKLRYAVHNFGLHTTSNLLSMMWKCGPWMTPPPCPCDERFGSACCDPGRPQLSNAAHARTRRSLARAASSIRIPSFAPSLACSFVRSYVASLRARLPASLTHSRTV